MRRPNQARRIPDYVTAEDRSALDLYLAVLSAHEPDGLFEVRFRRADGGMGQHFRPVSERAALGTLLLHRGRKSDVYLGVAPRVRAEGCRSAVRKLPALWADCDGPEAVAALAAFTPAPTIIVGTGTNGNAHAYWCLQEAVWPDEGERLNRRLAAHLGADSRSTDAARILRPPFTRNHKHDPPAPVTLERFELTSHHAHDVAGHLPDPPTLRARPSQLAPRRSDDPLLAVPAVDYFERLCRVEVPRSRKVRCPLPDHQDRTPSCHVGGRDERLWTCFGCGRGGDLYTLAAALWGMDTRGGDFRELRRRLLEVFAA